MIRRASTLVVGLLLVAAGSLLAQAPGATPSRSDATLASDLDEIFADPILARALVGIRVESLATGVVLYERDGGKLVIPASNMKLLTMATAAERLGWDYRYETRLEAAGVVEGGTLHGDLVVVGSGDPTIVSQDSGPAAVFGEWADALQRAGIRRIAGRIVGDDSAFDDDGLGAGWAWDYLDAGYAAPSGALSYNENVATVRVTPGATAGAPAGVEIVPPGAPFDVVNLATTGAAGSAATIELDRAPAGSQLTIRGTVAAGGNRVNRTTAVPNPTRFFVQALELALAGRGIAVSGGAWDLDDVKDPPSASARQLIVRRESLPFRAVGANFLKVSQNFYGEMILKTIGRVAGRSGTSNAGRQVVRDTMAGWGIPADSFVVYDGSGLSRYNYVSAEAIVGLLKHVWQDDALRGPFVAALPVGGHDGTLESRMRGTILAAHVQAKTGTIANVRSLSGYLETKSGEKLVFSMIANHFTVASAQVDAVVEKALARLAEPTSR